MRLEKEIKMLEDPGPKCKARVGKKTENGENERVVLKPELDHIYNLLNKCINCGDTKPDAVRS